MKRPCRHPRWSARQSCPQSRRHPRLQLADIMRQVSTLADAGAVSASWRNAQGLDITGITADSRHVAPGYLFAALPGARADGRAFIAEAVSRGAAGVLAPTGTEWPPGVPPRPLLEDP